MPDQLLTDDELQRVLKALADPNRRHMLELLAVQETVCTSTATAGVNCSMIAGQLPIAQPTVSHHVKELVHAELVAMTPVGTSSLLSLRRDTLDALFATLRERLHLP